MCIRDSSAIGLVAIMAIAAALPQDREKPEPLAWGDLRGMFAPAPARALLMTVLGYAGVFLVFTYIAPILTDLAGFQTASVSPLLMLFGAGLVLGNILGGKLADRAPLISIPLTLFLLAAVLLAMWLGMAQWTLAIPLILVFGVAAFATVAPLQSFILRQVEGTGQALASTLNISAFNLGNALGAWIGGLALGASWGLPSLFLLAAIPPALAGLIALRATRS